MARSARVHREVHVFREIINASAAGCNRPQLLLSQIGCLIDEYHVVLMPLNVIQIRIILAVHELDNRSIPEGHLFFCGIVPGKSRHQLLL